MFGIASLIDIYIDLCHIQIHIQCHIQVEMEGNHVEHCCIDNIELFKS